MLSLHFWGLNRPTEPVVNLHVIWLGFIFVLISFFHMHGALVGESMGQGNRLKLDVQGQGGGKILNIDGQRSGGLEN